MRVYALAASMVAFVYERGGPEALRGLRRDGFPSKSVASPDSLTLAWRRYVERAAVGQAGLSWASLESRGCG
jgi:hypothetical protein